MAAARTLDFVINGIDEYGRDDCVRQPRPDWERITRDLGRGVTIYRGYGGMTGVERDILHCVVTRLEVGKVKAIARESDEHAFVFYHRLAGAEGGVVKTRGFH